MLKRDHEKAMRAQFLRLTEQHRKECDKQLFELQFRITELEQVNAAYERQLAENDKVIARLSDN